MIDFVDAYMQKSNIDAEETGGFDEQRILSKSVSKVLPLIIKNELTPKQSLCLRMFYIHGKTQTQIAEELKLSQPTVSRHIAVAKKILNRNLGYCLYCVKQANEQWLKYN